MPLNGAPSGQNVPIRRQVERAQRQDERIRSALKIYVNWKKFKTFNFFQKKSDLSKFKNQYQINNQIKII